MNRRDLLKWFGAGATVVPVAGGVLQPDAAARLIEVPKVEPLIEATNLNQSYGKVHPAQFLASRHPLDCTLMMRDTINNNRAAMVVREVSWEMSLESVQCAVTRSDLTSITVKGILVDPFQALQGWRR